jgi:citronellol/citronellal dehydrogenase
MRDVSNGTSIINPENILRGASRREETIILPDSSAPLTGRTAIVTGASRGIGRAFALRLAREGAAVVVAAKSEAGTDRLPGSIYSVVAEIEAQGGRALAVRTDVRSDEAIAAMVARTAAAFGGVDILVNNAGAMWWEPVLATPAKRYDLMWEINVRASFLCAQHALPHMMRGGWGHIVNCSPPITTEPSPGYVAYMTTKMGMTRVAIGIAAEYRAHNIAANALWPATVIESQVTANLPAERIGTRDQWRTPEILCDALLEIVGNEPMACTGRQLIDEAFLRERGWSDERLDSYWVTGRRPATPMWIDGRPSSVM